MAQTVKYLSAMQETRARFLGWEDPLEGETATHSSVLAWRILWTGESGSYSPWGHKESDNRETMTSTFTIYLNMEQTYVCLYKSKTCTKMFAAELSIIAPKRNNVNGHKIVSIVSLQSCLTLCDAMDCNPLGFSVHRILQAKILEWVPISSSRASSWPRAPLIPHIMSDRFFISSDTTWIICDLFIHSVQFSCSVMSDSLKPHDCNMPGLPVHYELMSIKSAMPSNHLVLCHPLLLLPSIFPSIRVFSNGSWGGEFHGLYSPWDHKSRTWATFTHFSHQGTKVLELQFQHQSSHWKFRTDIL